MENKKDRLLLESEVIAAIDKHTNNYNRLDNDITCILEEVKGMNVEVEDKWEGDICIEFPPISIPEIKKKESKFPTIRRVINKYDTVEDIIPNILRALPYAIYKDLNSDGIEEMMFWLKFFKNNFYSGSKFQELLHMQIEKEIGE